jgi:transposase
MTAPLSKGLQRRIVAAVVDGTSRRAAAARFSVSESCTIKLMQRWQKTGSVVPAQMGGHRKALLHGHEAQVRDLVTSQPDITLAELGAQLAQAGIAVSRTSLHRFLATLGINAKKDTPHQRADPARCRHCARGLEGASSPPEHASIALRRRDLDGDEHGQALRPQPAWRKAHSQRAAWLLEDKHLPGGSAR